MAEGDGQEVGWLDILVAEVRLWHEVVLERSGGAAGEHTAQLFASCARPFQGVGGDLFFPTPRERAAALFHGIITSHPFVDGNKRTATIGAVALLIGERALAENPSPLQFRMLGELAVAVASSKMTVEEVAGWLRRILDP